MFYTRRAPSLASMIPGQAHLLRHGGVQEAVHLDGRHGQARPHGARRAGGLPKGKLLGGAIPCESEGIRTLDDQVASGRKEAKRAIQEGTGAGAEAAAWSRDVQIREGRPAT